MKYSEYGWLSENKDGWGIWDAAEESAGNNALEDCRKLDWQEMVEEDCADAFFLHECNGKCKECSVQEDYLEFFFCDDCYEYALDPSRVPDCNWCPIGLRKGKKQEEPEEIRRKRIEIEQTDTIPKCRYEDFQGGDFMLYIVRLSLIHI